MKPGYVVVGNIVSADSCLRFGARVVVEYVPGDPDKAQVRGLSRSGRRIAKWVMSHRIGNRRVAWCEKPKWPTHETREAAQRELERLPAPRQGDPTKE